MSGSRGGGGQPIPAGSRKVVQSLKDATLKDCIVDPVNRLLSQDPFHEGKSKRERKKEVKDNPDSRARSTNNSSTRRSKNGGGDRQPGCGASTPFTASDPGAVKTNIMREMPSSVSQMAFVLLKLCGLLQSSATGVCSIVMQHLPHQKYREFTFSEERAGL